MESNANRNRHNFSSLLLIITVFSFGLIFLRFSEIMVHGEIDGENLKENVELLYTQNHTLQANRGTIYDRHGNPIAVDATSYKMIGVLTDKWSSENNPQHIEDPKAVANVLANHINLSSEEILDYLTKDVDQVEFGAIGNNLSYHTVSKIKKDLEENELTGLVFEERKNRLYPNGVFASHTVGLAQYPQTETDEEEQHLQDKQLVGVMGIEASFNEELTGQNGKKMYKKDSFGYLIPSLENEEVMPVDGNDLYLTLDHKLQVHLETILSKVQTENTPDAITATVMDVETGEIIASGQRPSFNATTLDNIDASWQNLLTEYTFEPGSTMKMLTLAAAIQEGVFHPNNYYKTGTMRIYGETIGDVNREGWGYISQLEGIARSSNLLFIQLVEAMGHDVWKEYMDGFGLSQLTGVSLPYEQAGMNPYDHPLQAVTTGFGQGISVTPIQMLQAFTAIANKGQMMKPKMLDRTIDSVTNEQTIFEPIIKESPITPETAQATLNYLKQATEMDEAVARFYRKEDYPVIAKTGTAQVSDPETGMYKPSEYIYSVAAMIPADEPEYIVYITVQNPSFTPDASYGSGVVQKIYHPLVDRIYDFNEQLKSPGENEQIYYIQTPSYLEVSADEASHSLTEEGREFTIIGTGSEIVQQFPYPETPLFDEQQIILMTNGAATMPDLTNWSRNDALKVAELTGIQMRFQGEGYVVEQSLAPGAFMEPGSEILLTLSSEVEEIDSQNSTESENQIEANEEANE